MIRLIAEFFLQWVPPAPLLLEMIIVNCPAKHTTR